MAKAKSKAKQVQVKMPETQAAKVDSFKVSAKHVTALVTEAVKFLRHAHTGIRDIIVTWKGERPETLDAMKEEIKKQCKAWLKDEGRGINPQSIYNYQSDLIACCNGYAVYAGMNDKERRKFDEKHAQATTINSLVKFLRDVKRGGKVERPESTPAKRMKSAWKNHATDQYKKTKDMLRYAPTDYLLKAQDFIAELIEARKKGGEEGVNVRKLLKRAA